MREEIFDKCISVMQELRKELFFKSIYNPNILLNFYVREYFTKEEAIDIIKRLNELEYIREYIENIEEFV